MPMLTKPRDQGLSLKLRVDRASRTMGQDQSTLLTPPVGGSRNGPRVGWPSAMTSRATAVALRTWSPERWACEPRHYAQGANQTPDPLAITFSEPRAKALDGVGGGASGSEGQFQSPHGLIPHNPEKVYILECSTWNIDNSYKGCIAAGSQDNGSLISVSPRPWLPSMT